MPRRTTLACTLMLAGLTACTTSTPPREVSQGPNYHKTTDGSPSSAASAAWVSTDLVTSTARADRGRGGLLVEVAHPQIDTPSGLAVSATGRVFVAFPWLDQQPAVAVGERRTNGEFTAFPASTWNHWDGRPGPSALRSIVNAAALTLTADDTGEFLWVLDAGNPRLGPIVVAGPKLFKIDLADDSIAQVFYFDHERDFTPESLLSDLRVDAARGVAYVSDAGRGALVVVNLRQRTTRSVLVGHPSTRAEPGVSLHRALKVSASPRTPAIAAGVTGLALSADGQTLYYHALAGRTLYRVPTTALLDDKLGPEALAGAVENLGGTGSAIDGMALDPDTGEIYLAAIERDAILVRRTNGQIETLLADPRFQWPDSLAVAEDGYLYLSVSGRQHKRPFVRRPAEGLGGSVMKVSLDYLQSMAVAEREQAQAQRLANEAGRLAAASEARVLAARQAAERESQAAMDALRQVKAAAEAINIRRFELARADHEITNHRLAQEAALERAEGDAQSASVQEQVANRLSAEAEAAARVAAEKATEAELAQASSLAASKTLEESQSRVRSAAAAHGRALAELTRARDDTQTLRLQADDMQSAAEVVQARARIAADAWVAEYEEAREILAEADVARQRAAAAADSLEAAQLAELREASPVELADVTTE